MIVSRRAWRFFASLRLRDAFQIFGRFLLKILQAALAAKLDFLPLFHKHARLAHITVEFFARNDARLEGVRFRIFRLAGIALFSR